MAIVDKKNLLNNIDGKGNILLDLGCGIKKKNANYIGIDVIDYECVDLVGDIFEILALIPNNSVAAIYSSHFFEHVYDIGHLIEEVERILVPLGEIEIIVPHFSNPYFYSDSTHKNFFGLYSFSYFVKDQLFVHKVPSYNFVSNLQLHTAKLCFSSPLYISRPFKWLQQFVFNSFSIMKELYEGSCSQWFSCYEIKFVLKKYVNE